jgi:hypothetical protein
MDRALYIVASVIVPLATAAVGLYYSTVAMSRIRWPTFRCWVWAGGLGIVGLITLNISYSKTAFSPSDRHELWVASCVVYMAAALLNTYGTVCLVRRLLSEKRDEGPHV